MFLPVSASCCAQVTKVAAERTMHDVAIGKGWEALACHPSSLP